MTIALLNAPSNLGLRPPEPTAIPGCFKAPEALREAGLHCRLADAGAQDAGTVIPGRYIDDWTPGCGRVRNQDTMVNFTTRLAQRLTTLLDGSAAPLIIGGDCSLLLAPGLALAQRGRHGLVHIDGHSDFRHPAMSDTWASVAGEDLAAAIGLHIPEIADINGHGPYFNPSDVVHVGCRDDDEGIPYMRSSLAEVIPTSTWLQDPSATMTAIRQVVDCQELDGYWLHVDLDVLDPSVMPAVDSPDPGGVQTAELVSLLQGLAPAALGAEVCIYDPDLDPDGSVAQLVSDVIVDGLTGLGTSLQKSPKQVAPGDDELIEGT